MTKQRRIASVAISLGLAVGMIALVAPSRQTSAQPEAPSPCRTESFRTVMYKAACQKGGQEAAKDAAKKFVKDNKIKSCDQCHALLAPRYELKADALEQFHKLGGK